MPNLTQLNVGVDGDKILDIDLAPFVEYPIGSGKLEATAIYVGSGLSGAPTPLTLANPLPVQIQSGSANIGSVILTPKGSGISIVRASGEQFVGSVIATVVSGTSLNTSVTSGSVQVSGIVGVSGSVSILSGQLAISSGQLQLLSGSAYVGVVEGVFSPVSVGPASGQPFPVQIDGSGNLRTSIIGSITTTPSVVSGSVQVSGIVGISGQVSVLSGQLAISSGQLAVLSGLVGVLSGRVSILSGSMGAQVSGAVIVSGNVQLLSGSAWVGVVEGVFNPVLVAPSSGQAFPMQVDGSGNVLVSLANPTGAQVSGAVTVSGNVGVSGSMQLLSGSASVGVMEGIFSPVAVGPASGQPFPVQIDGSGNLRTSIIGPVSATTSVVSGSIQVSGVVGVSGSVNILSGQLAVSSGLVGVLSGSVGAQVSGSVQVSGIVGISGSVGILSGQVSVSSGLVGVLSGNISSGVVAATVSGSVQVSGAVIVSGNVGVSGSVQLLSGSAWVGAVEGVFSPVVVGPISGQSFPLQVDGSGNLKTTLAVSPVIGVSGSVAVLSGLVGVSSGQLQTISGSVTTILSGSVIGIISGAFQLLSGSANIGSIQAGTIGGPSPESFGVGNISGFLVKAGNTQLLGLSFFNNSSPSGGWLKIYDLNRAPAASTDTPALYFFIPNPDLSQRNVEVVKVINFGNPGLQFTNGLSFAVTGRVDNADITALSGQFLVIPFFK